MPGTKYNFQTSSTLKSMLTEPLEQWRRNHGGDLTELAEHCGVSTAYLSHVRRYGRVPSRPVLILLALNLGLDGRSLFEAARVEGRYPYDSDLCITRPSQDDDGVFSLRFNMDGFTKTIRGIVRDEIRQRSVKDLLGNRPLRIGMNYHMPWMFDSKHPPENEQHGGFFPELCESLGLALQKEVELVHMPFVNYMDMLSNGTLDLFGPTMIIPNLPEHILFTAPLFRLGISGVFRKRKHPELPKLPNPSLDDLRDEQYRIAVLKGSLPHLVVNTLLKRPDSTLILTTSDEEALERITLAGISRPAHVFITNSITALTSAKSYPKEMSLLFGTRDSLMTLSDVGVAIRPDWPEVVPVLNDAIGFLFARGAIAAGLKEVYQGEMNEVVDYD